MSRYPLGQPVRLSTTVKDLTGTLVSATTLTLTLQKPDLSLQTYNTPVNDSTGLYHQDVPAADLNLTGHYQYKWVATGTGAGVSYSELDVFDPFDVLLLPLQDAKDMLNIPQATTTYDAEIQAWVDTIEAQLERFTGGPIVNRGVTERVDASDSPWEIRLRRRPLVSVQSVTDVGTGLAVDLSDSELDLNGGFVRRKLGVNFVSVSGLFTVVYTAGWGTAVPAAFNAASRIILAHLWETQHGPALRPQLAGEDLALVPGFSFAVPNRALELLLPYAAVCGVA